MDSSGGSSSRGHNRHGKYKKGKIFKKASVYKVTHQYIYVMFYPDCQGGRIPVEHLSDNHGQNIKMRKALMKHQNYEFDQLLVLDDDEEFLVLSAKRSLIKYAQQNCTSNSVVHGYISNVTDNGCNVRIGEYSGFAPKNKAIGNRKMNILKAYHIGQSVRIFSKEVINKDTVNDNLYLKQSSCSSKDESFILDCFLMDKKIGKLLWRKPEYSDEWDTTFKLGAIFDVTALRAMDTGYWVEFDEYKSLRVPGFISNCQLSGNVTKGSKVKAVVLDVSKRERRVDLTVKDVFLKKFEESSSRHSGKKRHQMEANLVVGEKVDALVEIVLETHLVLSIPEKNHAIGYASIWDYNSQLYPRKVFLEQQSVEAIVVALPSSKTSERLLLRLDGFNGTSSAKRAKKSTYGVEA